MANGAPIGYSYSPSGLPIELIDLASTRSSTPLSSPVSSAGSSISGSSISWHPKLTLYRLLVIVSTGGLAAAKTATSYLNLTFASITLEWILGVVVFLFFHLLGAYETNNRHFTWLFDVDYLEFFWAFLEKLTGFGRPYYISDEVDTRHQTMGIHPLATGYRIIVTVLVASFGMTKSALLYGQEPVEATTVECVFGVGIVTGLYWLGLYEASSIKVYPKLFHVDYSGRLSHFMETAMIGFVYILTSLIIFAFFYGFYHLIAITFTGPEESKVGTIEAAFLGAIMFYYFMYPFTIVLVILTAIAVATYFMFKGFMFMFSEARNYFTVDMELVDAPV